MIRHCVMLNLAQDADRAGLEQTLQSLAILVSELEGCRNFCHGPNRDFEGKSADYDVGFTLDADDAAALAVYARHPTHQRLGADLVGQCEGGAAGIFVFDLEVAM